jgi:hypothetical protein
MVALKGWQNAESCEIGFVWFPLKSRLIARAGSVTFVLPIGSVLKISRLTARKKMPAGSPRSLLARLDVPPFF